MGSAPVPLSQFVLKVHSRCDLACDHCYVYEAADQSWRSRPTVIADDVVSQTAQRIAEHAAAHRLPAVQVVLHGGEPLLAGLARLGRIAAELRSALNGTCRLDLRIHTNGVLLNEQFCELFAENGVKVGISVDGDRAANDRHRRYADGRSSYDKVIRAIRLLRDSRFRPLYAGLLCTIDVANDPLVAYDSLMDLRPPRIDFLLPHATWVHPPVRTPVSDSEYADWLIAIFDRWLADGCPTRIRTFDSILSTLRGGSSYTEALGLDPVALAVVETDGSYEQVDSLKAAFDGAPETGMNVFEHPVDAVARHPGIVARQQGVTALSRACRECPVVSSCGGGLYTHRYRVQNGFDNPSVYCPDLLALISHVSRARPAEATGVAGTSVHSMSERDLRTLASGAGDAIAVARLIEGQRSVMRGLLGAVYQAGTGSRVVSAGVQDELRTAWDLLSTLDREQPVALEAVLGHPYLRVWAVHCLEQLNLAGDGPPAKDRDVEDALGYLGAVAAVAAAHAGMRTLVSIPVIEEAVHLPTLGRLFLGPQEEAGRAGARPAAARVSVISNAVIIRVGESCWTLDRSALLAGMGHADAAPGNSRSGEWQPVRLLRTGSLRVALDDTDLYRDCGRWPAAPRLPEAEAAAWEREFQAAYQEIGTQHAAYAPALDAGLTTLTPLKPAPDGSGARAVARHAFGAVAAAVPTGPGGLALLLIQEFQHAKLGAILDLYDLYDPADDRILPTPWEERKSKIEALLRGVYAYLAVAEFWHASQQRTAGPEAEEAGRRSRECYAQVGEAISTLLGSGALTKLGTRFLEEMGESVSACSGSDGMG